MQHEIDVEDSAPIRQQPYRLPEARKEVVKKEIDRMLTQGIVQPSHSPWASPIVLVEKKDGDVRFCVDYRKLNQKNILGISDKSSHVYTELTYL